MTDKEIIKALECCKDFNCLECPKKTNLFVTACDEQLCQEAIDLINRQRGAIEFREMEVQSLESERNELYKMIAEQKAEIDRYKGVIKILEKDVAEARNDGVKDFAERLERVISISAAQKPYFDNLVKELTEPTKIEHNSLCETETYKK